MSDDWAQAADDQEAKELANKVENLSLPDGNEKDATNADKKLTEEEEALSKAELSFLTKLVRKGIVECKNKVEVFQKDPTNPLFSVKTFEELNLRKELLEGIYDMGFKLPSRIQETALPTLLANPPVNMIAQSQSGTGKTAAFSLAMLSRIEPSKKCCQALCLSPTMELALQTLESVKNMGKRCTDITYRIAVKGQTLARGERISEHIVIGTPGKVVDWVLKYKCLDLRNCRVFVLDEADVMIATQGHQDQSVRIHKQLPSNCQMMLFSATYDDDVVVFAEAIIKDPVTLRLRREEETLKNIRQCNSGRMASKCSLNTAPYNGQTCTALPERNPACRCTYEMYIECNTPEEKYEAISNIYTIPVGNSMFFCHTKYTANSLAQKLREDGHHVALLTGDLTAEERVRVLTRYREGSERVLICTNVLSRGIDVESVNLVVNYDLPMLHGSSKADCDTYLHRIGRTGRFGKMGNAINIVDGENDRRLLREIENHFNIKILKLDYNNIDEIEKLGED